ncbi:MAG: hypothetical protein SFZ24_09895 [Planctomycetota bacterium]|nr:hypothetical protein [Planctomycetota bacterium]
MRLVLDPYEISDRSASAFLALLLAEDDEGVGTAVPGPGLDASAESVRQAMGRSGPYVKFLESWRWTADLWQSGLLRSVLGGPSLIERMKRSRAEMAGRPELASLMCPAGDAELESELAWTERVCRDLAAGGRSASLRFIMGAVMEELAAECGAILAGNHAWKEPDTRRRSEPASLRFALPAPARVRVDTLLEARRTLADALELVRGALDTAIAHPEAGPALVSAADALARELPSVLAPAASRGTPSMTMVLFTLRPSRTGALARAAAAGLTRTGARPGSTGSASLARSGSPILTLESRRMVWDVSAVVPG